MHFSVEVVIPPVDDIDDTINRLMSSCESDFDNGERPWFDFWRKGGRFSGNKLLASLSRAKLREFEAELNALAVSVSCVQCGKPELNPETQIETVNKLWQEYFPGTSRDCPYFHHFDSSGYGDVCLVKEVPERLTCSRLIVAKPDKNNLEYVQPVIMLEEEEDSLNPFSFDGNVKKALDLIRERDSARGHSLGLDDNWVVVTLDCHY